VRPVAYPSVGADAGPVVNANVDDVMYLSKEIVIFYDAVITRDVLVLVFPCMGVFDSSMAAKCYSAIGASGNEHCTCSENIHSNMRTAPLRASVCELIFQKFHQMSTPTILRSRGQNSAECSMNEWRDAELISRAVSRTEKNGLHRSWLQNPRGSFFKAVRQHRLAASVSYAAEPARLCRAGRRTHEQAPESIWPEFRAGVDLRFWKTARNQKKRFIVRSGSTVYAGPKEFYEFICACDQQGRFPRVCSIGYFHDKLQFCCKAWSFKDAKTTEPNGQPSEVFSAAPEVLDLYFGRSSGAGMRLSHWYSPSSLFKALRLPLQVRLATRAMQAVKHDWWYECGPHVQVVSSGNPISTLSLRGWRKEVKGTVCLST